MSHDPRTELPQPSSRIIAYIQGKTREALFVYAVRTADGQMEWTLTFHGDERTVLTLADIGLWSYAGRDSGRSVVSVELHDHISSLVDDIEQRDSDREETYQRYLDRGVKRFVTVPKTPVTPADRGLARGCEVEHKFAIPGLFKEDGKTPVTLTDTLVIDEVAEDWISARPWGADNTYVFGNHPEAIAPLGHLTLLPKRETAS